MERRGAREVLLRSFLPALLAVQVGNCRAGPTSPTPPAVGIHLECPPSLLIGQSGVCTATATSATGLTEFLTGLATWSVTPSEVAQSDGFGRVTGRSAGTATVRASYGEKAGAAEVVVKAEDGLVVTIGIAQGSGRVGEPATIGFSGWYAVVSGERGALAVVVRAGDGTLIVTAARDLQRGGGSFGLDASFRMPAGVGRVCGEASLRIDGRLIEPTGPLARPICIDEVR